MAKGPQLYMYKLTIRKSSWPIAAAALVIPVGLFVVLCGSSSPWKSATIAVPIAALVVFELAVSLFAARLFYALARLDQIGRVAGTALGCILALLAAGLAISTGSKFVDGHLPGGNLVLNWFNLVFSNAFGVLAAISFWKIEPDTAYASPTGEMTAEELMAAEAAGKSLGLGTHKSADTSSTKLRGILDKLDSEPQTQAKPEAPQPASQEAQPAQEGEKKSAASATATRLQAQKRKSASTFTKLQALSSSAKTKEGAADESADLKDILERLDEEPVIDEMPAQAQEASFAPPEPAATTQQEPPKQEAKGPAALGARLMGVITKNKMPAAEPEHTLAEEPMAEAADEDEEQKGLFSSGLDQEVDDIFNKLAPPEAHREVADAQAEPEPAPAAAREPQPEPVEAKAEPEPTVAKAEPEPQIAEPEPVSTVAEPAAKVSPPEPPEAEPVSVEADAEAESERSGLFEKSVDSDIDDIFSTIAPQEAMREVSSRAEAEPAKETISFAPEAEPAAPPEPEPAAEQEEEESKLFAKGVDADIEDIFSNIAPQEAQRDVSPQTLGHIKPQEPAPAEPSQSFSPSSTATGELDVVGIPLDQADLERRARKETGMLSRSDFEAAVAKAQDAQEQPTAQEEAPPEDTSQPQQPAPANKAANQLKEFGKLSARSANEPKATADSVGTMKTIGKLLLDVHVVENIIKAEQESKTIGSGLTTARVISAQRGEGIQALLSHIDQFPSVTGSLIVGHDGLVIAATPGITMDKDILGALSTALLSTTNLATKKLEIGKLHQMALFTTHGTKERLTVLTDVDVGILAVFCDVYDSTQLDGLMEAIHSTIHGG